MYACRCYETGTVFQSGIKSRVSVATLPGSDIDRFMRILGPIFPNLTPAANVLETSFNVNGAMLHPIPTIMNLNKMDLGETYDYYMEGITPHIADLIAACDQEKVAVCRAMGVNTASLMDSLIETYKLTPGKNLYSLIQGIEPYRGLKNPTVVTHRFLVEDTMSGLVPLSSIGKLLNVETPIIDAFINLALSLIHI